MDLVAQIERGQGGGPLGRHFQDLSEDLQTGPFRFVLVGLDAQARGGALGLFCGQDIHVMRLQIPDEVGLVDVRFGERGYVLEGRDGERRQFDQLEPFLVAVQAADLVREGDARSLLSPMTLQLEAPLGAQGLHVLMPESLAALRRNPRLLGRLAAHGNVLVVAGQVDSTVDGDDAKTLGELAELMPVAVPLVLGEGELPKRGFWSDRSLLGGRFVMAAMRGDAIKVPDFAQDATDPLRVTARAAWQAKRLSTAAMMVRTELQEDRGQIEVRLRSLQREQKALEEGQRERDMRGQVERLRTPAIDHLRQLADQGAEDLRRIGIAGGALEKVCAGAVQAVGSAQLLRMPLGSGKVRLVVAPEFLEQCSHPLYEELTRAIKAQALLLREGARALDARLAEGLSEIRQATVGMRLPSFDEDRVCAAIKELLQSDLEAKAEIDRRGFLKRLSHGRQLVFTLLMSVSLFGSALPFGRDQLLKFVVPLFVGGVVMTVFTWRREDRERVDRELERMREQLRGQLARRGADALRELGERARRHLDELREQSLRQIDAVVRESEQLLVQRARDDVGELQQRTRSQEQRRRDLDALLQRVGELERLCAEVERDAMQYLQSIAKPTRPSSGGA